MKPYTILSRLTLPALLALSLISCEPYVRRIPENCSVESPDRTGLLDLELPDERRATRILISSQNRQETDPAGELFHMGEILSLPMRLRNSGTARALPLRNRDQLPFHPMGLGSYSTGRETLVYVINYPVRDIQVIEVFRLGYEELQFVKRIRSPLLDHPVDLVVTGTDEFYVTNYGSGSLLSRLPPRPSILRYKDGEFRETLRGIPALTGIALDREHKLLHFASVKHRRLYTLDLVRSGDSSRAKDLMAGPEPALRFEKLPLPPGLLSLDEKGSVFLGASPVVRLLQRPRYRPSKGFRSEILMWDGSTLERIYGNDEEPGQGTLSALPLNNYLYAGQIVGKGWINCYMAPEKKSH